MVRAETIPLFINDSIIAEYPADQIDALAFANYGEFTVKPSCRLSSRTLLHHRLRPDAGAPRVLL
jgi:hypothetical protein